MKSHRRKFIKNTGLLCGGIGLGATGLVTSCTPITYVSATLIENKLLIKKADWGESSFVVVKSKRLPKPLYVCQLSTDNYVALLMECTHKQCEVRPSSQGLNCPCHGSEFDRTGKVLEGPAREDLAEFTVASDEENIYIG
ncbi:MAG: ubiquinol-cytochrome c reductase iron-sulfur subunit [Cyclobacteriaceae bacterium]